MTKNRDRNEIIRIVKISFNPKKKQRNIYGDGKASEKIVEIIGGMK